MDIENQTPVTAPDAEVTEPTTVEPEAPQEPQEIVNQEQAPSEPDLYELPDGRKVDGNTLVKEWKENFLPDYTKKSQELSKMKEVAPPTEAKPWEDENWVPNSYKEVIEIAEQRAIEKIKSEQEQERLYRSQLESSINSEIEEIKKSDPSVNENSIYLHANKFGFTSLTKAYENMQEIKRVEQSTEQRVLKNIQSRGMEPVNTGGQSKQASDGSVDFNSINNESPMEMLRRLTSK